MVKRAKYIIKTTRDGNVTRQEFTMVDPPDYPRAVTTSNLPFEKIKHLMSSRPYDLGEADTSERGSKSGSKRSRGRKKGSR
jgi:hypothetical protein